MKMNNHIAAALLLCLVMLQPAYAQTGADKARKYFKIDKGKPVDEFIVRDSIMKIVPVGTGLKEAIKKLEKNGIKYWETCTPADRSPIWCYFKSPKDQLAEANYTVEFFFDKKDKFKNVVVVRSYSGRVRRFTTYVTKPASSMKLKNNLYTGSKVKEFDTVYGQGELNQSTDFADDWPVTLEYHDKEKNKYFYIGVDIGDISTKEKSLIEQDRSRLGELKAGIVFEDWPDPQYDK